jgi:Tol biopolymer transport system component
MTALAAWGWLQPGPLPDHATRLPIDLGNIALLTGDEIIVSPDGSRFALAGIVEGLTALYWRDAAEENFRLIPETRGAEEPSFSPDGDWIVYATESPNALFKVSLSGGAPTTVVPSGDVDPRLPHWGDDGMIVFTGPDGLFLVPDTGGEPEFLRESGLFVSPSLLPGGRAVIGHRRNGGIMLLDLETDSVRELIPGGLDPRYVETGHILYVDASGGLWAVPFDANRSEMLGGAVPIFDGLGVIYFGPSVHARYSVSRNGTLVYGAGGRVGPGGVRRLLVVDLQGNEEAIPLDPRNFCCVRWSPDGESVAYQGAEPGTVPGVGDIYTYNVELRTAPRRLTFGSGRRPVWSPDGTRVAFGSQRDGTAAEDLFVKTVNDDSPPQMIVTLPGIQLPTQWPSDDLVIFESGGDLWMVDLSSDSAVVSLYLESEDELYGIMVSPDGALAAYTSTDEVYVRSFPEARQPETVSQGGGAFPFWSPDGGTIYYWTLGPATAIRSLIATRIERGPPFVVTSRDTVIAAGIYWTDLHPDGDRLVVVQDVGAAGVNAAADEALEPERFLVVVNWFEELLERLGN